VTYGPKTSRSYFEGYNPEHGSNMFFVSNWLIGGETQDRFLIIHKEWAEKVKTFASDLGFSPYTTISSTSPPPPMNAPRVALERYLTDPEAAKNWNYNNYYSFTNKYGATQNRFIPESFQIYSVNGDAAGGAVAVLMMIARTAHGYWHKSDREKINLHASHLFNAAQLFHSVELKLPTFLKLDIRSCGAIVNCITDGRLPVATPFLPRSKYNSTEYQEVIREIARDIKESGISFNYKREPNMVIVNQEFTLDRESQRPPPYEVQDGWIEPSGNAKKFVDKWQNAFPNIPNTDDSKQKFSRSYR